MWRHYMFIGYWFLVGALIVAVPPSTKGGGFLAAGLASFTLGFHLWLWESAGRPKEAILKRVLDRVTPLLAYAIIFALGVGTVVALNWQTIKRWVE